MAPYAALRRRAGVELSDELADTRIDKGFEVGICNQREGKIKDLKIRGADGGEVAMEEDRMKDALNVVSPYSPRKRRQTCRERCP